MAYFAITNVTVQWGTEQVLANATQYDLFEMSRRNGSNQSWLGFSGVAQNNVTSTGNVATVYTEGSVVMIKPAYDMRLEQALSGGSQAQQQVTITVTCVNTSTGTIANPELAIVIMDSGSFSTDVGSSQNEFGLLYTDTVIKAKMGMVLGTSHELDVELGGAFNRHASALGRFVRKHARKAGRAVHESLDDARNALISVGAGELGAGRSYPSHGARGIMKHVRR